MIFNVPGHIEMIRNGLYLILSDANGDPTAIVKTETRRLNRGVYQIEANRKRPHKIGYAVQLKRGVKAEPDLRIIFDRIWEEKPHISCPYYYGFCISQKDAWAEGGYTRDKYEKLFRALNPKWHGGSRWAYKFHAIEVQI